MKKHLAAGILCAAFAFGALPVLARNEVPQPSDPAAAIPSPPPAATLPAVPKITSGYTAPEAARPQPGGDLVGTAGPFVGIALRDVIAMALQRNTDLAIGESNQRIANFRVVEAKGAYDVQFVLQPQYAHSVLPATSPLQAGPNSGPITVISDGLSAGFMGMTAAGGRYSLRASQQTVQNDAQLDGYDPFYQTSIALQFTQPLLKGSGAGNPVRRRLTIAKASAQAESAALLTQASNTILSVTGAYWDLVAAWKDLGIQEEGLRNAQAQAGSSTRRAREGAVAPSDIVQSYTQINVFQDSVFSALQRVQALQNQLKTLILGNDADPLWSANLVPASPVQELPPEPKLDDLLVTALAHRPEFARLHAQRLASDANLAYAKNRLLPQLDLGVGVSANGFSGVPNNLLAAPLFHTLIGDISALDTLLTRYNATAPPGEQIPLVVPNLGALPAFQAGGAGTSWRNLFDFHYPAYNVSLTLQFPIGNHGAKAEYAIAAEQSKQVAVQEIGLLQRVRSEATNAIQTYRETQSRLTAAAAAKVAAERVLLAEQRRFEGGSSTSFLVLQRQLDLANTEDRELRAQTDLDKAVAQLEHVAGTSFASAGIDVTSR